MVNNFVSSLVVPLVVSCLPGLIAASATRLGRSATKCMRLPGTSVHDSFGCLKSGTCSSPNGGLFKAMTL